MEKRRKGKEKKECKEMNWKDFDEMLSSEFAHFDGHPGAGSDAQGGAAD